MNELKAVSAAVLAVVLISCALAVTADEGSDALTIEDVDIGEIIDMIPGFEPGDQAAFTITMDEDQAFGLAHRIAGDMDPDLLGLEGDAADIIESLKESNDLQSFLPTLAVMMGYASMDGNATADITMYVGIGSASDGYTADMKAAVDLRVDFTGTLEEGFEDIVSLTIPLTASGTVTMSGEGIPNSATFSAGADIGLEVTSNYVHSEDGTLPSDTRTETDNVPFGLDACVEVEQVTLSDIDRVLNGPEGILEKDVYVSLATTYGDNVSGMEIAQVASVPTDLVRTLVDQYGTTFDIGAALAIIDGEGNLTDYTRIQPLLEVFGYYISEEEYEAAMAPADLSTSGIGSALDFVRGMETFDWYYIFDGATVNGNSRDAVLQKVDGVQNPTAPDRVIGNGHYDLHYSIYESKDKSVANISELFMYSGNAEVPSTIMGAPLDSIGSVTAAGDSAITLPDNIPNVPSGSVNIRGYTGPGSSVTVSNVIYDLYRIDGKNHADATGSNFEGEFLTVTPTSTITVGGEAYSVEYIDLDSISGGSDVHLVIDSTDVPEIHSSYSVASVTVDTEGFDIPDGMFRDNQSLTSFTANVDIGTIGSNAFYNCTNLSSVQLMGVESIGRYAFSLCNFESLHIAGDVGDIGRGAFASCVLLSEVAFDGHVGTISDEAFDDCRDLRSVTFGAGAEAVYGFENNGDLTTVVLKGDIGTIGQAFNGCENLSVVDVRDARIGSIGIYAFRCTALDAETIESIIGATDNVHSAAFSEIFIDVENEVPYDGIGSDVPIQDSESGIRYSLFKDEGEASANITYLGDSSDVTIPSEIGGYPVRSLFMNSVTESEVDYSIEIPSSVRYVGDLVATLNISSISIQGSEYLRLESSGGYSTLVGTGFMESGGSILYICGIGDTYAFPEGVSKVRVDVLDHITAETLVISDSVTEIIGLTDNTTIKTVRIGAGVENLDLYRMPSSVERYEVDQDNLSLKSDVEGVLFTKDGSSLVGMPTAKTGEYTVPAGVTHLERDAFNGTQLSRLVIPEGVWVSSSFAGANPGLVIESSDEGTYSANGEIYIDHDMVNYNGGTEEGFDVVTVDEGTVNVNIDNNLVDLVILPASTQYAVINSNDAVVIGPMDTVISGGRDTIRYETSEAYEVAFEHVSGSTVKITVDILGNNKFESMEVLGKTYTANTATFEANASGDIFISFDNETNTVTFETGSQLSIEPQQVGYGMCATYVVPYSEGRTFVGWYTDEGLTKEFDFSQPIYGDLTLYAKWKAGNTITFNIDESKGSCDGQTSISVGDGFDITFPSVSPAAGYRFVGWVNDHRIADIGNTQAWGDMEFTAAFVETDRLQLVVRLDVDPEYGRLLGESRILVPYGDELDLPTPIANTGYRFVGWTNFGIDVGDTYNVLFFATLVAQFEEYDGPSPDPNPGSGTGTNPGTTPEPDHEEVIENPDGSTSTITTTTTEDEDGNEVVIRDEVKENQDGSSIQTTTTTTQRPLEGGGTQTREDVVEVVKDTAGNTLGTTETSKTTSETAEGRIEVSTTSSKDSSGQETGSRVTVQAESDDGSIQTSAEMSAGTAGGKQSMTTTVSSEVDESGTIVVDADAVDRALSQIQSVSEHVDVTQVDKVIQFTSESTGEGSASMTMAAEDLAKIADSETDVSVSGDVGTVRLPPQVAQNLASSEEEVSVGISTADRSKMTDEQRSAAGDREVYDLFATVGGQTVSQLGGEVTITVPYTLRAGEDPSHVTVYYIADNGAMYAMNTTYDPVTQTVSFTTNHFSYYMVGTSMGASDGDADDDTVVYIVAAVVVVIVAAVVAYVAWKR